MNARREARRRRILENSEDRIKRVMGMQASTRKVDDDNDGDEQSTQNETTLENSGDNKSSLPCSKTSSSLKANEKVIKEQDYISKVVDENISKDRQDIDQEISSQTEKNRTPTLSNGEKENVTETAKGLHNVTLWYRILLVSVLGAFLVTICTLKCVGDTLHRQVCQASFLPYFITLEIIILCLSPIKDTTNNSSMILLALRLSGFTDAKLQYLLYLLNLMSRISQDFCWFIFTVILVKYLFECLL